LPRSPIEALSIRLVVPVGLLVALLLWPVVTAPPPRAPRPRPSPTSPETTVAALQPDITVPREPRVSRESAAESIAEPSLTSEPLLGTGPSSIPGLRASDLNRSLEQQGFSCSPPSLGGKGMTWACHASSGEIDYTILVEGQSTTAIRSVRAVVTLPAGSSDVLAGMFLGSVAALSYVGAEPERARVWVRDHVSTGGRTAIGAINFTSSGGPQKRTLDIVAPGSASP
jgi:hypothetical protein